jgi:WD40 repeat protein
VNFCETNFEVTLSVRYVFIYSMKLNHLSIAILFTCLSHSISAQIALENDRLQYQLATKDLLRRSENVTDPQLLLLLAKQSAIFAERYGFEEEIFTDLHRLAYRARKASLRDSVYQSSRFVTQEIASVIGDSILNQFRFPFKHYVKEKNRKPTSFRSVGALDNDISLLSVTGDGRLLQWNVTDRTYELLDQNEHYSRIVAHSPNEKWLAIATNENGIELLDLEQKKLISQKVDHHSGALVDLVFLPDNTGFITVGIDRRIVKRDFINQESTQIAVFDGVPTSMSLSGNGENLVVFSREGKIILYDLSITNNVQSELHTGFSDNLSLEVVKHSQSGRYLALGGFNPRTGTGFVQILDTIEKKPLDPILRGFVAGITDIEFSMGDRWIAASSRDNSTRVWKIEDVYGFPIILEDHNDWVWDASFDQNGKGLYTASADGILRYYYLDYNYYLSGACDILERNLDIQEWTTFVGDPNKYPLEETCPSVN